MSTHLDSPLIDIKKLIKSPFKRSLYALFSKPIESFLKVKELNEAYAKLVRESVSDNFFINVLNTLDISYEVSDEDLKHLAQEEPTVVVSNHPRGGIDGVILGAILTGIHKDSKLLANYLLNFMTEISPWIIPVDPFNQEDSKQKNFKSLKETLSFLKKGGCLGTFPAGNVSDFKWKHFEITDGQWNNHIARIIKKSGASVVPVYFQGHNSLLFQVMRCISPVFSTLMLIREMLSLRGSTIQVRIGKRIPFSRLESFDTDQALMDYVRLKSYILKDRSAERIRRFFSIWAKDNTMNPSDFEPIQPPQSKELMQQEVSALPVDNFLVEKGDYKVYYATAQQVPTVLKEIGRLREKTFREVSEGTGKSFDLDEYDQYYVHLFLWDAKTSSVIGAYRLGHTDEIMEKHGKNGLYTSTLFKYKSALIDKISPALEAGRSFIVTEYQRKVFCLWILWRGIIAYVVRNPKYKILFGPVSISREYNSFSRDLMIQFLRKKRFHPNLSSKVKAKNPPRFTFVQGTETKALLNSIESVDECSAIIGEMETRQGGIPVLLRHYLKLNGQLLSFNIDNSFGQCLDGLILVDLTQSDPDAALKYFTKEGYISFMRYHGVEYKG